MSQNSIKIKYYYIDNINGSDENDGSKNKPYATFDKALKHYDEDTELRFAFIGKGNNYNCSTLVFNSIGMHLKNLSENKTIKITFTSNCAFYNCHINVNYNNDLNNNFEFKITDKLYNDGGCLLYKNTIFSGGEYCNYGGTVQFETCTFKNSINMCRIDNGGTTTIKSVNFDCTDSNSCALRIEHGTLYIQGKCEVTGKYKYLLYGIQADLRLACGLTSNTSKTSALTACTIFTTQTRYNTWFNSNSKITQCFKGIQN